MKEKTKKRKIYNREKVEGICKNERKQEKQYEYKRKMNKIKFNFHPYFVAFLGAMQYVIDADKYQNV